ncbi:hypothetical protein LCGC14_0244930 [marine sediment metagenome]|uniref:Uncharacterized protein n=1 Tax=marine sediment metagenome TaxID=412755 RepID=A0A0F9WRM8_9ZZZZ
MENETPTLEERVEALEAAVEEQKTHTHTVRAFNQAMQIRTTSEPVVEDGD